MSRLALVQSDLVIADDVLGSADFRGVRDHVARADYRGVHDQKWDRVWRLWDGHPKRGSSVYYDPDRRFDWQGATYPTHGPLDALIDAVRTLSALHPEAVGVEGLDWTGLYLCPWLYPVGSALSLHQDSVRYSGSFAFFAHVRWQVHWGGELMVYPPLAAGEVVASALPARPFGEPAWMSDENEDDALLIDIATAVAPRPNRLALIGEHRPHRIARVDANAGAHLRASLAGFFLR